MTLEELGMGAVTGGGVTWNDGPSSLCLNMISGVPTGVPASRVNPVHAPSTAGLIALCTVGWAMACRLAVHSSCPESQVSCCQALSMTFKTLCHLPPVDLPALSSHTLPWTGTLSPKSARHPTPLRIKRLPLPAAVPMRILDILHSSWFLPASFSDCAGPPRALFFLSILFAVQAHDTSQYTFLLASISYLLFAQQNQGDQGWLLIFSESTGSARCELHKGGSILNT